MSLVDISIIIPTYNRLWALPKAIDSCRKTKCSHEIIVVDDGSTDGTQEWLNDQKDLVILRLENWGKDWAVNAGLARAKGKYVRFLDSDDWLLEKTCDAQLIIAEANESDVVVAGYQVYHELTGEIQAKPWIHCDDFISQQLGECDSSHYSAYLFKKACVEKIPHRQEFGALDDRMFIIETALQHPKVSVYDQPAFVHRHHKKQRLQFAVGMREIVKNVQHLKLYQKAASILDKNNEFTQRRKDAIAKALWPLAHWIARTHVDEGVEVEKWIYCLNPRFQPPEKGLLGILYRRLGFRVTENLLSLRRSILWLSRVVVLRSGRKSDRAG